MYAPPPHKTPIGVWVTLILALVLAFFVVVARADAAEPTIPGERSVATAQWREVEQIAQAYWTARDVILPVPVEAFAMPDDSEASGRGVLSGHKLWVAESYIPVARPGSFNRRYRERQEFCTIYLHERGHNAGLEHEIFPVMYEPWGENYRIVRCERWASI